MSPAIRWMENVRHSRRRCGERSSGSSHSVTGDQCCGGLRRLSAGYRSHGLIDDGNFAGQVSALDARSAFSPPSSRTRMTRCRWRRWPFYSAPMIVHTANACSGRPFRTSLLTSGVCAGTGAPASGAGARSLCWLC
jgi:hypothetical protein